MSSSECGLASGAPGCDHAPVKPGGNLTESGGRVKARKTPGKLPARPARSAALAVVALFSALILTSCGDPPWNDPYPADQGGQNVLYGAFSEQPAHLDPARSYSANEYAFIAQVYEPPLQYHFLKRPYQLLPLTAEAVPHPSLFDADGKPLPADAPADAVAVSEYLIRIRPGIRYQPHPAFAKDADGRYLYHDLDAARIARINTLSDLPETATRELTAEDYVYQIKRLATPWVHSPIAGLMGTHILGFQDLSKRIGESVPVTADSERRFSTCGRSRSRGPRWWTATATGCASRGAIRSFSIGSRCHSSRRCPGRSTPSMPSRG